ncbi:MAG: hypothetical protein M1814_004419 [Vezdaea aestivalis]|nr:MAG: hypothetical protein M1814_004419 [Vezdaea aestivalis]
MGSTPQEPVKCIIDASAFVHGISDIKIWALDGSISIHVAEFVIGQLITLSDGSEYVNQKAREAIDFIKTPKPATIHVLQGSYKEWGEADSQGLLKSTVPKQKTYLEVIRRNCMAREYHKTVAARADAQSTDPFRHSHSPSSSDRTPSDSSESSVIHASPGSETSMENSQELRIEFNSKHFDTNMEEVDDVPRSADSLLKAIVYRIHQESGDFGDETSYSLVTVDQTVMKWAKKFGVPMKRLDQLRELLLERKGKGNTECESEEESEDEIVFGGRNSRASAPNTPPTGRSGRNSIVVASKDTTANDTSRPSTPLATNVTDASSPSTPKSNKSRSPNPGRLWKKGDQSRSPKPRAQRNEAGNASLANSPNVLKASPQPPRGPRNQRPSLEVYQPHSAQRGGRRNGRFIPGRPTSSGGYRASEGIPTGPIDPNDFRRGGNSRDPQDVDYTLTSGAPRSATRGQGRLWVPS